MAVFTKLLPTSKSEWGNDDQRKFGEDYYSNKPFKI